MSWLHARHGVNRTFPKWSPHGCGRKGGAEWALDACPLGHNIVSVIDEEPQSPLLALGNSHIAPTNGGASDRPHIDRVDFSLFA